MSLEFSPEIANYFIFYALQRDKIDTKKWKFDVQTDTEENLFKKAQNASIDILKLSTYASTQLTSNYILSPSGNNIGRECGSLLVSKTNLDNAKVNTSQTILNHPWSAGEFLLNYAYPNATKIVYRNKFDIGRVLDEDLIIVPKENESDILDRGFKIISDLGAYWENLTWLLCPIDSLLINKSFSREEQVELSNIIRESIRFAFQNKEEVLNILLKENESFSRNQMELQINLYVNDYSLDIGSKGKTSINRLFETVQIKNQTLQYQEPIWLE